jgi:hypothetical protein
MSKDEVTTKMQERESVYQRAMREGYKPWKGSNATKPANYWFAPREAKNTRR